MSSTVPSAQPPTADSKKDDKAAAAAAAAAIAIRPDGVTSFSASLAEAGQKIVETRASSSGPSVADTFRTLDYGLAPENADAANKWLDDHKRDFGVFVDNKWVPSTNPALKNAIIAPGNGAKLCDVPDVSPTFGTCETTPKIFVSDVWIRRSVHCRRRG